MLLHTTPWHWIALLGGVALLLALDLGVFHPRVSQPAGDGGGGPTLRASLAWTAFWIALAAAFGALLWWWAGAEGAARYASGYLVEWSLSADNVFVFVLIFNYFRVPRAHQYRVLFWGVIGAIAMRLAMVLLGARLIAAWDWVLPLLGLLIIFLAIQLLQQHGQQIHPDRNPLVRWARRVLPISSLENPSRLLVREEGRLRGTQLLLALIAIETADVVMAIDSVPAIFGVTRDPFIVFSSNVMAILGLRALYFVVADAMDRLRYLNFGIGAVLAFIGLTMVGDYAGRRMGWLAPGDELVPYWASLAIIASLLSLAAAASWVAGRRTAQ